MDAFDAAYRDTVPWASRPDICTAPTACTYSYHTPWRTYATDSTGMVSETPLHDDVGGGHDTGGHGLESLPSAYGSDMPDLWRQRSDPDHGPSEE